MIHTPHQIFISVIDQFVQRQSFIGHNGFWNIGEDTNTIYILHIRSIMYEIEMQLCTLIAKAIQSIEIEMICEISFFPICN